MEKKLTALILTTSLLAFLVLPLVTHAVNWQEPTWKGKCEIRSDWVSDKINPECNKTKTIDFETNPELVPCCIFDSIYIITTWIFWVVVGLVVMFVLLGAFFIVTAAGSPEKITKGRNFMIWAAVGAVVAFAAKFIPAIAAAIAGIPKQ